MKPDIHHKFTGHRPPRDMFTISERGLDWKPISLKKVREFWDNTGSAFWTDSALRRMIEITTQGKP